MAGVAQMWTRIVLVGLVLLAGWASGSACTCNRAVGPPAPAATLSNAAQQVTSLLLQLIPGAPALPHQLAVVTGAMFEARAVATGGKRLTSVAVSAPRGVAADAAVAYGGYAALRRALAFSADKQARLDAQMRALGFGDAALRDGFGGPIAAAVAARYPLTLPPPPYTPPNAASRTRDARCSAVTDADGWQPLCVPRSGAAACAVQAVPFLPFVNASLITADGAREVDRLVGRVAAPPAFDGELRGLARARGAFAREYRHVRAVSARLDDRRKVTAEVFAPNAALGVHAVALDEVATRGFGLRRSVAVLFAVSAAVRDGFAGAATVKVRASTTRPVTVLQCGLRGRAIRAWRGPYRGVGRFRNGRATPWRSYIATPGFPGFVSGHTTVAGAGARVLQALVGGGRPAGANCFVVAAGASAVEPRVDAGAPGHIAGVTDVPNRGARSAGFSPARDTTVCWASFADYARLVARSRLFGGVHTRADNRQGLRLGRRSARRAVRFVQSLM